MAQAEDQTTIDLTLEDTTPPPITPESQANNDILDDLFDSEYLIEQPQIRGPPFSRRQGQDPTEPITISDSDDENLAPDRGSPQPPQSPEVQLVGERQVPRRVPSPPTRNLPSLAEILRRPSSQPELGRVTPPELRRANTQTFRDTLRNAPGAIFDLGRNIFGAAMGPVIPPAVGSHPSFVPLPGNPRSWITRHIPLPLDPIIYDELEDDEYSAIDLDYHDVGFPMGGLEILDPTTDEVATAAAAAVENVYKPPPPAKEGFTRDIEEDGGVLVCVACEDELATGNDDVKQQVWVAKNCGHVSLLTSLLVRSFTNFPPKVFCGSCASQRVTYRKGNDRDRNKAKRPKVDQLRNCKVPGCTSRLTGKTAMFQIYL